MCASERRQEEILTYNQAESVTKGRLCPGQAVVWQVDILCSSVDVAPAYPGG